jgi:hypothetical protein
MLEYYQQQNFLNTSFKLINSLNALLMSQLDLSCRRRRTFSTQTKGAFYKKLNKILVYCKFYNETGSHRPSKTLKFLHSTFTTYNVIFLFIFLFFCGSKLFLSSQCENSFIYWHHRELITSLSFSRVRGVSRCAETLLCYYYGNLHRSIVLMKMLNYLNQERLLICIKY